MADLDRVREALEEKGFALDNPADMLAALADSIAYQLPTYATNGFSEEDFDHGQSFSLSSIFQNIDTVPSALKYEPESSATFRARELAGTLNIRLLRPTNPPPGLARFQQATGLRVHFFAGGNQDNPLFPALRSGPTAGSGASLQKQIPSSKSAVGDSGVGSLTNILIPTTSLQSISSPTTAHLSSWKILRGIAPRTNCPPQKNFH